MAAAILIPLALIVMAICGFYVYKKCYKRGGERHVTTLVLFMR